tara:strand:- start:1638 stop:1793 length:156 start_codon:yes stop_codon:yes gene_type:complete
MVGKNSGAFMASTGQVEESFPSTSELLLYSINSSGYQHIAIEREQPFTIHR